MSERYAQDSRYTAASYFALVEQGLLSPRDRVELLEGVIVAEPPMDPAHASAITLAARAVERAVGDRALVRIQAPLIAGPFSVPEPDVAVVPGQPADYFHEHPTSALLVVEVSESSLQQDRLSKSRVYAGANVMEYWIANLRERCIEIFRDPDPTRRLYAQRSTAYRGELMRLVAFPDACVGVDELLPDD